MTAQDERDDTGIRQKRQLHLYLCTKYEVYTKLRYECSRNTRSILLLKFISGQEVLISEAVSEKMKLKNSIIDSLEEK